MTDTMTDGPTDGSQPGGPGGPPWAGLPRPLAEFRRSDSNRWLAGVAGGAARQLGIEPWIARTIALALGIIGIGIPLYVLAWLLLPTDTRPSIATERGWNRNTVLAICALVVIASLALVGPDDIATPWRAVPWIIIACGVFLLVRRDEDSVPAAGTAPTPPPPPPVGAPMGGAPVGGWPTPPPPPSPPVPPAPPRRPRRMSLLTPLTLFALLALAGVAVLVGTSDTAVVAAIGLCIVGGVLLVSSIIGRARGLIVIGLLIAVPLVIGLSVGSKNWGDWGDFGDRTYRPVTATPTERSYERGFGTTVLDLRDLRFSETRATDIELDQIAGEVIVWLPDDTTTVLSADVLGGEIDLPGRLRSARGVDLDDDDVDDLRIETGDGRNRLELDIELGAGRIEINAADLDRQIDLDPEPSLPTTSAPTTVAPPTSLAPAAPPVPTDPTVPSVPTAPAGGTS